MREIQGKLIGILIVLSLVSLVFLNGETHLDSLEDIALYGSENNLSYQSSQISLLEADGERVGLLKPDQSTIDFNAAYDELKSDKWSLSSTLTVPLMEQISLMGKIEEDMSGRAGIILNPLRHSSDKIQSEIDFDSTLLVSEGVRLSSEKNAVSAALSWMSSYRDYETQKILVSLKEINYSDDKVRYDLGEVTLDDLQASLIEWSEARVKLSDITLAYRDCETSLLRELGSGKEDVTIGMLSLDDLKSSLLRIQESIDPESGNFLKNNDYLHSLLNVSRAREIDKSTWIYEPDLELAAYLNFDRDGDVTVSADFSLTLSLDQVQQRENRISEMKLELSLKESEQSRNAAELEFQQIVDSISSTEINSEIAKLELEQAHILLSEAEFLQKQGEYSTVDLEEMKVIVSTAENSYYESLANEYKVWLALKEYL